MSETEELRKRIDNSRYDLLAAITTSTERAKIGRLNESKLKEVDANIEKYTHVREELVNAINYMIKVYKNIEQYAANRKELALNQLTTAIEKAGLIVPDADVGDIHLSVKDKTARILDNEGTDVNLKEGSAYRTVLGALIRYTLIKAQPDAIQMMLLDELFNTLSDETITAMRDYLDVFKEDTLIIGIEQHDVLFQGIDKTVFTAVKEDGVTRIIKEE